MGYVHYYSFVYGFYQDLQCESNEQATLFCFLLIMARVNFNTRDELVSIDLDLFAAAQASGSYTRILYITKREFLITANISKVEEALKGFNGPEYKFLRLGRSVIINHKYLMRIELNKQQLILSDGDQHDLRVRIPKQTLRVYKDAVAQSGHKI